MNIIFLTQKFPYPLTDGGNIRSFHILRILSKDHRITLISNISTPSPKRTPLDDLCAKIITVPESSGRLRLPLALARSLLGRVPYFVYKNYSPGLHQALIREINTARYHAVHFNHLDAAYYQRFIPGYLLRILDTHNILTTIFLRLWQQTANPGLRGLYRLQWQKTRQLEAELFARMHLCLVCSAQDAAQLQQISPGSSPVIIPNGVDTKTYRPRPRQSRPPELLFIGALDYLPNREGILTFCRQVLPRIWEHLPQITLTIIGRKPPQRLQQLAAQDPRIRLLGKVEKVWEEVHGGHILVVPLLVGGGTRLKILEAMACGLPVVSTAIGAEGITAHPGEQILLADTIPQLADHILTLCRSPQLWQRISQGGRRLAEEVYDWEIIGHKLLEAYRSLPFDHA